MSRIVGFFGDAGRSRHVTLLDAMLEQLPGTHVAKSADGRGALGWKGRSVLMPGSLYEDGRIRVVVDGHVLNKAELCEQAGASADGAGVIAALYRRYGFEATLRRLSGDFAIALFDGDTGKLWLGRDRFGVKPLYYVQLPNGSFAFASQPRILSALKEGNAGHPNRAFVARFAGLHYRAIDNAPNESPYEGVSQLPAACIVDFANGAVGTPLSYWRLVQQPDWTDPEDVLAERYRGLLLSAVARRLAVSGKPLFTLSGGLDSSSVLCGAATIRGTGQYAVSAIYADTTYDERHEIRDVVREKVAAWIPVEIGNEIDIVDIVGSMVRMHDEPVATATWLSHAVLTKQIAASGFDTLFGGLGGDELNAGEYEYFPMFFADLRASGQSASLDAEISLWAQYHDHPIFKKDAAVAADMMGRLCEPSAPGRCLADQRRLRRYADVVRKDYFDLSKFTPVMDAPFDSYLKNRTYQDMFRETLPCCLRAEDRQCTAMGLVHFDPFLDHELVEFMYRVPGRMKIRNGVTKHLLRKAMFGILPEATRSRIKKTGWNAPAHRWFDGRVLENLRDMVASRRFREDGVYDPARVTAIIDDHVRIVAGDTKEESHMMFLWQLLNVELWLGQLEEMRFRQVRY